MEYPPAFRLQDKTTGKHDLRHMTKHEQSFLSVPDTVIRVQLRTDSIQFFIPSKKQKQKSPKAIIVANCANSSLTGKTRQDLHVQEVMPSRG